MYLSVFWGEWCLIHWPLCSLCVIARTGRGVLCHCIQAHLHGWPVMLWWIFVLPAVVNNIQIKILPCLCLVRLCSLCVITHFAMVLYQTSPVWWFSFPPVRVIQQSICGCCCVVEWVIPKCFWILVGYLTNHIFYCHWESLTVWATLANFCPLSAGPSWKSTARHYP